MFSIARVFAVRPFKRRIPSLILLSFITVLVITSLSTIKVLKYDGSSAEHQLSIFEKQSGGNIMKSDKQGVKAIPYEVIQGLSTNYILHHSDANNKNSNFSNFNPDSSTINWSKFAYVTYFTSPDYLLSAVLNAKRLRQFNTEADITFLQATRSVSPRTKKLIEKAKTDYQVKVIVVGEIRFRTSDPTWANGFTKFHVFNLTQYDRVIFFDSDCLIYQNMDELFLGLPPAMIYTPAHYLSFRDLEIGKVRGVEGVSSPFRDAKARAMEIDHILGQTSSDDNKREIDVQRVYERLPSANLAIQSMLQNGKKFELADYLFVLEPNEKVFNMLLEECENRNCEAVYDATSTQPILSCYW
ncbi:unnamed protein product [Ambrosiozyma monospora]|uniref:Unnamed protein product n=1 Tax=Ambrosiozyma monospora TaxID=43982 RepID=A0ACB5T7N2_AMBMO|nr:unnamed protein product [Ambrosiozyma monospora]